MNPMRIRRYSSVSYRLRVPAPGDAQRASGALRIRRRPSRPSERTRTARRRQRVEHGQVGGGLHGASTNWGACRRDRDRVRGLRWRCVAVAIGQHGAVRRARRRPRARSRRRRPARRIKEGGSIVVGLPGDMVLADPSLVSDSNSSYIQLNVIEGLLGVKAGTLSDIEPVLAESIPEPSDDGLTYTFKLRTGHQVPRRDGLQRRSRRLQLRAPEERPGGPPRRLQLLLRRRLRLGRGLEPRVGHRGRRRRPSSSSSRRRSRTSSSPRPRCRSSGSRARRRSRPATRTTPIRARAPTRRARATAWSGPARSSSRNGSRTTTSPSRRTPTTGTPSASRTSTR